MFSLPPPLSAYELGPDAPPPLVARAPPPAVEDPTLLARFGVGYGSVAHSDEERLLELEGYGGGRPWLELDVTGLFDRHFGLGGFAAYTHRSSSSVDGSPDLRETTFMFGAQLPWVMTTESGNFRFMLIPRIGRSWSTLSLGSGGALMGGWVVGGEASFLFPKAHVGGSLGYVFAPLAAPGALGRAYDAGGLYLAFQVVLDG